MVQLIHRGSGGATETVTIPTNPEVTGSMSRYRYEPETRARQTGGYVRRARSSGFPGPVAHAGEAVEVSVLSPERGVIQSSGGQDHAVRHGQPRVDAQPRCG